MTVRRLTLTGLDSIGEVKAGDDLAALLLEAVTAVGETLREGDIVAVAQKIVSKAEGRMVRLADVVPAPAAQALAAETGKDPRLCQLLLDETRGIVRQRAGLAIVEDIRGLVLANAGIDASNVSADGESVLLLPRDPDASAARLHEAIAARCGVRPGVVILDSIGRAWRMGTVGTAIGVAGIPALLDLRGRPDMHGRKLETSELGLADEIAAAASLLMGQADEHCPAVLVRGLDLTGEGRAADLLRPRELDLFR
jgi:coenzyme F420-0:L-glutamate ligase / coenzyme F420-1:gamma-L-glutamate ligase